MLTRLKRFRLKRVRGLQKVENVKRTVKTCLKQNVLKYFKMSINVKKGLLMLKKVYKGFKRFKKVQKGLQKV